MRSSRVGIVGSPEGVVPFSVLQVIEQTIGNVEVVGEQKYPLSKYSVARLL